MPKVSVITPVYNGERYLKIALDSLLAQTFSDWELIVVDDGSIDATPEILAGYEDRRIIKLRQPNSGEATARNNGLDHAMGEYVAFLDADDLYLPNALEDLSQFLDCHPEYGVVFADGYLCDSQGNILSRLSDHRPGIFTGNVLEPLILDPAVVTVPVCTMSRLSAIRQCGARFDRDLVIGPDWDFWIQMARFVSFGYLDRLTCMYRVHDTNITRTSGWKKRRNDLVHGRMKVMNSEWFNRLSLPTKRQFFYNLVVGLLEGQIDRQREILESKVFQQLPDFDQAQLWRQSGSVILRGYDHPEVGLEFLRMALSIFPRDRKARFLLACAKLDIRFARLALWCWRIWNRAAGLLRSSGRARSRPLPTQLGPVKD